MADNLDFESFEKMDDLDWSSLEKEAKDAPPPQAGGHAGGSAPSHSGGASMGASIPGKIDINYLLDVNLQVTVEVGRRHIYISQLLAWGPGSIVELDKLVGEPLNLLVNGKPVAKGEVVVVNDKFAVKIISILDPHDRLAHLSH